MSKKNRPSSGNVLFILACAALTTVAVMEFRTTHLRCRNAYLQRMVVVVDSLRNNHGITAFPRLPSEPYGTVGDTLYMWGFRPKLCVKALWPEETPWRRCDAR